MKSKATVVVAVLCLTALITLTASVLATCILSGDKKAQVANTKITTTQAVREEITEQNSSPYELVEKDREISHVYQNDDGELSASRQINLENIMDEIMEETDEEE